MSIELVKPVMLKVYAYILDTFAESDRLLVFEHVDFPEAGIQVPGGSVEPGERPKDAVLREAREETGISNLKLVGKLGVVRKDMGEFGLNCVHERHFYQFDCLIETPTEWIAFEYTPSDGSESPIAFRFYWEKIENPPMLSGGLGEFLNRLL